MKFKNFNGILVNLEDVSRFIHKDGGRDTVTDFDYGQYDSFMKRLDNFHLMI